MSKKANKEGWIRHRGGKCPVDTFARVDIRLRGGEIWINQNAADDCSWSHDGGSLDIMAYRLHKPEQSTDPVEAAPAEPEMPAAKYFDGPLQWRDRITEIDRAVEALEEERASLIQKLADEGLKLIERGALDPEYWREGDLLECLVSSGNYTRGKLYSFLHHSKEYGSARTLDDKGIENGMLARNFKWHSRPTK